MKPSPYVGGDRRSEIAVVMVRLHQVSLPEGQQQQGGVYVDALIRSLGWQLGKKPPPGSSWSEEPRQEDLGKLCSLLGREPSLNEVETFSWEFRLSRRRQQALALRA